MHPTGWSDLPLKDEAEKYMVWRITNISPRLRALQREYRRRIQRWRTGHDVQILGIRIWSYFGYYNEEVYDLSLVSAGLPTTLIPHEPALRFEELHATPAAIDTYSATGLAFYLPPDPQRAVWIRKWFRKWSRAFEASLVTHILSFL